MISRDFGNTYAPGCQSAPPPLHIYDTDTMAENWCPYQRPALFAAPGITAVLVPTPMGSDLGDDPTDPARQSVRRFRTNGMAGRFNISQGAGG